MKDSAEFKKSGNVKFLNFDPYYEKLPSVRYVPKEKEIRPKTTKAGSLPRKQNKKFSKNNKKFVKDFTAGGFAILK